MPKPAAWTASSTSPALTLVLGVGDLQRARAFQHDLLEAAVLGHGGDIAVDRDCDQFLLRATDQLAGRLVGDHPAVVDDRDAVAELLRLLQIMRGQHHGDAAIVQGADVGPQLLAQLDVDPRGRLVEHQHRGRVDHRLGDHQPPLHPARQRAGIGVRLVLEVDGAEQVHALPRALGDAVQPGLDLQRLERGEEGIEQDLLVDDPDRRLGVPGVFVDVEPPDRGRVPLVLLTSPARMLMSVDLPAPLGPSSPKIAPCGTSIVTPSNARLPPCVGLAQVADRRWRLRSCLARYARDRAIASAWPRC